MAIMEAHPDIQKSENSNLLHVAGAFLLVTSLASAGFFGAYAVAERTEIPAQQVAAVAAPVIPKPDTFANVTLIAKSAYVVDLTDGRVLYALNPTAQLPLASLTKVPLVLSIASVLSPGDMITIPSHTTPDGAPIRVVAGSQWRVQDLIDFTLVASSNEGAELLAQAANPAIQLEYPAAPAQSSTLWLMNQLGNELHLPNTYFLNVTGLDLSTTQAGAYGSAEDVAAIFAYAASTTPVTFEATEHDQVSRGPVGGPQITAQNTDHALAAIPGLIFGKTGYTDLAGGNLAIVFNAVPSHPVVAVVMGSTQDGRFEDMKQLIPAIQAALKDSN